MAHSEEALPSGEFVHFFFIENTSVGSLAAPSCRRAQVYRREQPPQMELELTFNCEHQSSFLQLASFQCSKNSELSATTIIMQ